MMTDPVHQKSAIRRWRWLLAGTMLVAVAVLGIRFGVNRTYQFYRVTGQLRQRGVGVSEGRPEWMHSLGVANRQFPFTDALQLDGGTDADVQTVAELTYLQMLRLDSDSVTDAGLSYLRPLTGLRWLALRSENITDAGLRHLQGLRGLDALYLECAPVTDAGLKSLYSLTRLKILSLKGTKVTRSGITQLKAALPGVKVEGP